MYTLLQFKRFLNKRVASLLLSATVLVFLCVGTVCVSRWFYRGEIYLDYSTSIFSTSILSDKVHVDTSTADDLSSKIRVLCFVTAMRGHEDQALAVNVTWLKRCTRHIFVSTSPLDIFRQDEMLILTNVPEGRDHLTAKTFAALDYLYKHELNNYDWFLKADDDTYVVMENLRLLLSMHSPDDPVYLGQHIQTKRWQEGNGYMSGGASYVLSRQALRQMGEKGFQQNGGVCRPEEPDEDLEVGKCLHALGIAPMRTVDVYGRETFHMDNVRESFFVASMSTYPVHVPRMAPECCSQLSISFHHLAVQTIYTLELLLYHIDVYGRHPDDQVLRSSLFLAEDERRPFTNTQQQRGGDVGGGGGKRVGDGDSG